MDFVRQLTSSVLDFFTSESTPSPQQLPSDESIRQVIQIALLLRQLLPADLVPLILDHAQLWPTVVTASSSQPDRIGEAQSYKLQAAVMLPTHVPRGAIRRIRFTTVSRDQGWSDFSEDHNTYNGSWTWFEAGIRGLGISAGSPDSAGNQAEASTTHVFTKCQHRNALDPEHIQLCVMQPARYKYGSKSIVTNVHAGREIKTHVVEWDANHEDEDVRRMINEVRGGCIVEVAACARFQGWVNYVQSVKIEIDCAVVRKL